MATTATLRPYRRCNERPRQIGRQDCHSIIPCPSPTVAATSPYFSRAWSGPALFSLFVGTDGVVGYAGYHPPRVHQEEDVLSDANVKNGFALPLSVSVCPLDIIFTPSSPRTQLETSTAQPGVSEALHGANTLAKLEELMNQVFARRSQQLPPIPCVSTLHFLLIASTIDYKILLISRSSSSDAQ